MYQVPKNPQGRPVSKWDWLRDLSALGLAGSIIIFGMLDSVLVGTLLGPTVGLAAGIFALALCITLARSYGRIKLERPSLLASAWLRLFFAALFFVAPALLAAFFAGRA